MMALNVFSPRRTPLTERSGHRCTGLRVLGVLLVGTALPLFGSEPGGQIGDAHRALLDPDAGVREVARATLTELAEAGHAAAANVLASARYSGRGLPRDLAAARRWWRHGAELGDAEAAYNIGVLLLAEPDQDSAAHRWLRVAAEQNHALACFALGTAVAENRLDEDLSVALTWLECAARSGYAPAQYNLASLLARHGDSDGAKRWFGAAAATFAPAANALRDFAPAPALDVSLPTPATSATALQPTPAAASREPRDRDWVLSRPPDNYTIQVAAGSSEQALQAMLARYLSGVEAACFLHRPAAREPWSVVVGSFPDRAAAELALTDLPPAIQRNQPWIRRFATLHAELTAPAPDAIRVVH